ncbi:hypothetical protein U1Q18_034138 [Sarracenia purpurea var. burkii]
MGLPVDYCYGGVGHRGVKVLFVVARLAWDVLFLLALLKVLLLLALLKLLSSLGGSNGVPLAVAASTIWVCNLSCVVLLVGAALLLAGCTKVTAAADVLA